ncbi:protein kinase domain-containing protein [Nocardioides sp.]|uniref:serine/threonine-protein kinase n=1 Tax=Nocardioides sp. TaxID=35761 RepID=UPI0039E715BD
MTTAPRERPVGPRTVGSYTLLAPLGEGGMGVVHLARAATGERVALKLLRPQIVGDEEARRRLAREVSSLSRVRSRWVAEIIDADPWAPEPFVATRYVPGFSLHDEVARSGPIGGDDLAWLARCLLEGIAAVHAAGVLHRDVKPSNVLMEGRSPVLIDFGLARVADDPKLTAAGWLLGTPGYLAPEVLYGDDPTPAVDVHAWAATVAYAATGRPPYGRGPSMAVMDRARRGQHDLTGVPSPLREVLDACLAPAPEQRPTLPRLLAWLRGDGPVPVGAPPTAPARIQAETMPLALAAGPVAGPVAAPAIEPVAATLVAEDPTLVAAAAVSGAERARRLGLLGAGWLAWGAGLAAYPWLAMLALLVLTHVTRTCSLAASTVVGKRELRGAKWYDGPRLVLGAPWDVLRALPATLLAWLWSLGLGIAALLLCYAVAAPLDVSLFLGGLVLVGSLWWGPGGARLRGPARRLVHPVGRGWKASLIVAAVVLITAGTLGSLAARSVDWRPGGGAPFTNLFH